MNEREFGFQVGKSLYSQGRVAAKLLGVAIELTPEETEAIAVGANLSPIPDGVEWKPGLNLVDGTIVYWKGKNYIVIEGKGHISQPGWEPDILTNLFNVIREDYAPWILPQAHNAYMKGDKVTHNGKLWICAVDNNGWEPGVYGWDEI